MTLYQGYCPIHEWERADCGADCLARKREMWRIGDMLNELWRDRMEGRVPATQAYRQERARRAVSIREARRSAA